jgi:hypothetical protein
MEHTQHIRHDQHIDPERTAQVTAVILRPGDTLWSISGLFRTSVPELQRLNGLGDSTLIFAGALLRVPASPTTMPPAVTTAAMVPVVARHAFVRELKLGP